MKQIVAVVFICFYLLNEQSLAFSIRQQNNVAPERKNELINRFENFIKSPEITNKQKMLIVGWIHQRRFKRCLERFGSEEFCRDNDFNVMRAKIKANRQAGQKVQAN